MKIENSNEITTENDEHESPRRLVQNLTINRGREGEIPRSRFHLVWVLIGAAVIIGALGLFVPRESPQEKSEREVAPSPAASEPPQRNPSLISSAQSGLLEASGFVVARRQATVSADVTGRLAKINVEEGSFVKRGDVLAELDARIPSAQVAYAEAQIRSARRTSEVTRTRIENARQNLERTRALAAKKYATQAQLDTAVNDLASAEAELAAAMSNIDVTTRQFELQKQQLEGTRIVAPFNGVVTELAAHVGEIVSPISAGGGFTRTGICTIVDLDSLEGEVNINEQHLGRIRKDQSVEIRSQLDPEMKIPGKVTNIAAAVERNTAAVKVAVGFEQRTHKLIPGMRIDLTFAPID